jgi:hypothetical protein
MQEINFIAGTPQFVLFAVYCTNSRSRGYMLTGDRPMLMMMSFICSCRNKNQTKAINPKGTSHDARLFRGPSTIDMKK